MGIYFIIQTWPHFQPHQQHARTTGINRVMDREGPMITHYPAISEFLRVFSYFWNWFSEGLHMGDWFCLWSIWSLVLLPFLSFFFLIFFNWRIIALQNFAIFCQTSTWISHRLHISPPFWNSLPSPSPSHPSRSIQSPCLSFLSHTANYPWLSILHMVMKGSMLPFPYITLSPPLYPCP